VTQVHISSPNHTVTVNHDGDNLDYILGKAQRLWDETRPPDTSPGPAYGFTAQIDSQYNHDRQQGSMWRPVRAEVGPDG
jgi:hypothetical protein